MGNATWDTDSLDGDGKTTVFHIPHVGAFVLDPLSAAYKVPGVSISPITADIPRELFRFPRCAEYYHQLLDSATKRKKENLIFGWTAEFEVGSPGTVPTTAWTVPIMQLATPFLRNYPNPFNPTTVIIYQVPETVHTTLRVYDVPGRLVATLVDAKETPGEHSVKFDGGHLPSSVCFSMGSVT